MSDIGDTRFRVISLADATRRRAHIENQFAKRGIEFEFFDAVDARKLDLENTPYRPHFGTRWQLTQSEVAVFESHRALWRMCVEKDWSYICIFEDDIVLGGRFKDALEAIVANAADFDAVKLDWHPLRTRVAGLRNLVSDFQIGLIAKTMPSAAAYIVSYPGAQKLLRWSETYCDHLDDFVFMPRRDWRLFQIYPTIAVQAYMIDSEAGTERDAEVTSGQRTARLGPTETTEKPPLTFKVMREIRKAVHKSAVFWDIRRRGLNVRDGQLPLDIVSIE